MESLQDENERLRAALVHNMERWNDLADIVARHPWPDYERAEGFMRASARRCEQVLLGKRYHEDIHTHA